MLINKPVLSYAIVVFKVLIILSALALMPVLWSWMDRGVLIPHSFTNSWYWMIKDFFNPYWPFAIVFFSCALVSIRLWWRKPRWYTALLMYFMVAVVCGAPGMTLLGRLFIFSGR